MVLVTNRIIAFPRITFCKIPYTYLFFENSEIICPWTLCHCFKPLAKFPAIVWQRIINQYAKINIKEGSSLCLYEAHLYSELLIYSEINNALECCIYGMTFNTVCASLCSVQGLQSPLWLLDTSFFLIFIIMFIPLVLLKPPPLLTRIHHCMAQKVAASLIVNVCCLKDVLFDYPGKRRQKLYP